MNNPSKTYVIIIAAALAIMFVVLNLFPRSTFSERERRDLAHFPALDSTTFADGSYTRAISNWYSDSEPFRDGFLTVSETFDHYKGITISNSDGEQIAYISGGGNIEDPGLSANTDDDDEDDDNEPIEEDSGSNTQPTASDSTASAYVATPKKNTQLDTAHADYSKTKSGVMLVGKEPNVRAMMCFSCSAAFVKKFTSAVNAY
ncbi:MAG: hypothetical protein K6F33_00150, partial [Bacteroidales bacterium]|nr:hypothetical protein [Bacteroidales bacterium]